MTKYILDISPQQDTILDYATASVPKLNYTHFLHITLTLFDKVTISARKNEAKNTTSIPKLGHQ